MERYVSTIEILGLAVLAAVSGLGIHLILAVEHHNPATFQRGGGLVVLIGLALAGLPYLGRSSIEAQAESRLPPMIWENPIGPIGAKLYWDEREAERPAARRAVLAERVIAFNMIFIGTIINLYGDLLLGAKF